MKIIAKRSFISSKAGIGNVTEGRVMDVDNNYAKMLIDAGLAEEYSAAPLPRAKGQKSFISPVEASAENGSLSQAAQASQSQIAKKSKRGVKKTKTTG
jgi:hypothetical protein